MKPRPEKVKRIALSDWKIIGYMAIHFMVFYLVMLLKLFIN